MKFLIGLLTLLAVFSVVPAQAQSNVSVLYGYNGTAFVPVTVSSRGAILTDLNLSESVGISPQVNNTYDMGTALRNWANLYVRSVRSNGPALSLFAGGSERVTVLAGGNVGISTTNPISALDIRGSVNASGFVNASVLQLVTGGTLLLPNRIVTSAMIDSLDQAKISITIPSSNVTGALSSNISGGGTASYIAKWINGSSLTSSGVIYENGTNIGIGTTDPQARLHVIGNAFIDGNLRILGNLTSVNISGLNVNGSINPSLDNNFDLGNATSRWRDAQLSRNVTIGTGLVVDTTTLVVDGNINRVGIGTVSPAYPLDVAGNVNAYALLINGTPVGGGGGNISGGGIANYVAKWNNGTNLINTIIYDDGTNIGINTSSPGFKLHILIDDTSNESVTIAQTIDHTTTATSNGTAGIGVGLLFRAENAQRLVQNVSQINALLTTATNTSEAGALAFLTRTAGGALTERVRIDGSGSVGIGTTAPAYKLDVSGTVNALNVLINGSAIQTAGGGANISGGGAANYIPKFTNGTNIINSILYETAGKIGIGTTAPDATLHVAGNAFIDGNLRVLGNFTTVNISALNVNGSINPAFDNLFDLGNSTNKWRNATLSGGLLVDAGTFFVNGDINRVGIGTTSPTTALDVAGTVTATAFSGDGSALTNIPSTNVSLLHGGNASNTTQFIPLLTDADGTLRLSIRDAQATNASNLIAGTATGGSLNLTGFLQWNGTTRIRNVLYTWPSADGSSGQFLQTSGAGVLSWAAVSGTNLSGGGATNRIVKWQNTTHLTNSQLFDDGTFVGIGTTSPNATLDVRGNIQISGNITPFRNPTFFNRTPDTTGSVGLGPFMINGTDNLSIIAYHDSSNSQLKIVKCGNFDCSSGNTITTIGSASSDSGYEHASIALGNDTFPVISYFGDGTKLTVLKCGNTACSSGNTITDVNTIGNGMRDGTSIAVGTDGIPVITYFTGASGSNDLKFARCGNAACSSGNTFAILDGNGSTGYWSQILISTDGNPVIAYLSHSDGNITVIKCGNTSCNSGNTKTVIDQSVGGTGGGVSQISMAIGTDGFPIISYYNNSAGDLKIAKCGNAACSSGNTITLADSTGTVGGHSSIRIGNDGKPIVSYYDSTNADLKVLKCGNTSCSSGNIITKLDTAGDVGSYTSLVIMNDTFPMIAYYDATNTDLKVLKCLDANCTTDVGTAYTGGTSLGNTTQYANNVYAAYIWGKITTVSSYDVAEEYEVENADVGVGDIVCVSDYKTLTRCDSTYNSIIGVVSEKPGVLLGEWEGQKPPNVRPVALVGRTHAKVSNESGPISVGDYIAISSMPGVGMKAVHAGKTVGIALEKFDGPGSNCGPKTEVASELQPAFSCGSILVAVKAGEGNVAEALAKQQTTIDNLLARISALEQRVK